MNNYLITFTTGTFEYCSGEADLKKAILKSIPGYIINIYLIERELTFKREETVVLK